METNNPNYEVMQVEAPNPSQLAATFDTVERANIDMQVATAHRYPRDLTRCLNNATYVATMSQEAAQSCGYALPRGNKPITGPSVNLARIMAQQYGNLRAEAKVVQITDRQVVSRGVAWDLENNMAVAFEVRRSIINRDGHRYNDDMITVTGNAANAIAYRNAVFNIIPQALTESVYRAAQRCITGDLTDEEKLIKRRTGAIQHFKDMYDISEEEVVRLCGKQTVNQIQADQIALLLGIAQSLKDGDTTVAEIMEPLRRNKETLKDKLTEAARKSASIKQQPKPQPQAEAAQETEAVDVETGEVKARAKEGTAQTSDKNANK